jgi:hypothetical protein
VISQKAQIKAHQASLESYAAEEQLEREKARAEARDRVLRDFERGLGLGGAKIAAKPKALAEKKVELGRDPAKQDVSVKLIEGPTGDERGVKRKFELDESAMERLAREAEDAALKAIEAEQVSFQIVNRSWDVHSCPLGRIEKSKTSVILAANSDARSYDWTAERCQASNDVQCWRTPSSPRPQEPITRAFHLSSCVQD